MAASSATMRASVARAATPTQGSVRVSHKRIAGTTPFVAGRTQLPGHANRGSALIVQAQKVPANGVVPWRDQWLALNEAELDSVKPEEAMRKVTAGEAVMIDVRLPKDYDKCHALDAKNVPLFKPVDLLNTDFKGVMRFVTYSLNGVAAVEPNLKFVDEVAETAGGKGVVFYCEAGGTMEPSPNFLYGKDSRSLRGAFKALNDGRTKPVFHMGGGLYQWFQDGFEVAGEFDSSNLGRTPNAAPTARIFEE